MAPGSRQRFCLTELLTLMIPAPIRAIPGLRRLTVVVKLYSVAPAPARKRLAHVVLRLVSPAPAEDLEEVVELLPWAVLETLAD